MTRQQGPPVTMPQPTPSVELLHDLRTAIHHIIGYSEMLVEQAESERQSSFIRTYRTSTWPGAACSLG